MEKNEANTLNDDYADLPEPLRPLAVTVDRIIQDDYAFNVHLIELVYFGLKPSHALWLYCRRYDIHEFVIGDLLLDDHPMVAVLEWIREQFLQNPIDATNTLSRWCVQERLEPAKPCISIASSTTSIGSRSFTGNALKRVDPKWLSSSIRLFPANSRGS